MDTYDNAPRDFSEWTGEDHVARFWEFVNNHPGVLTVDAGIGNEIIRWIRVQDKWVISEISPAARLALSASDQLWFSRGYVLLDAAELDLGGDATIIVVNPRRGLLQMLDLYETWQQRSDGPFIETWQL